MFKRKKMVTTDNEISNQPIEKKNKVTKDDASKMKEAYVKGATIDELADIYGYESQAVSDAVVNDVPAPQALPTQAELDASPAPAKKGK